MIFGSTTMTSEQTAVTDHTDLVMDIMSCATRCTSEDYATEPSSKHASQEPK